MGTIRFILIRLAYAILVLLGLSMLVFVIARVMPGDPARMALGFSAPEAALERYRAANHLDEPIPVQYYVWLTDAFQGRLGDSILTRRDVIYDIKQFLPATLELAAVAGVFMAVLGNVLGMIAARWKDTWIDNVVRGFTYVGVVAPTFVFAIFFILVFAYWLHLMPTFGRLSEGFPAPAARTGLLTVDSLLAGDVGAFLDAAKHLLLPALALSMPGMAQQARITRSSILDNQNKDYVAAQRSLGVSERVILSRFLLKPSLIPSISILGLDFAAGVSGAFVIELVFNWPGLSRYGMNAMLNKDLNAIVGVVLVYGVMFMTANLAVDIVTAQLDPRIKAETGEM
jgi:peptide/nickel transport system permease protein